jgi:predicted DNA binding CopG/RHH family protein
MNTENLPAPAPTAASFAHLLAALATPAPSPESDWNDEALAEDVATLSYERALRSHARYRPADPSENSQAQSADAQEAEVVDFSPQGAAPLSRGRAVSPEAFARAHEAAKAELAQRAAEKTPSSFERNLKSASITIRMSKAECEQLHRRAAEAGLTVSAYLRSCTFEAEALRAQVKDVLTELRSATTVNNSRQSARQAHFSFWALCFGWMTFAWLKRFFPPERPAHRVAQA